mgnify:CR=1 FL=1
MSRLKDVAQYQDGLAELRPRLRYDDLFASAMSKRPVVMGYYFSDVEADGGEVLGASDGIETGEREPERGHGDGDVIELAEDGDDAGHEVDRRDEVASGSHDRRASLLGEARIHREPERQTPVRRYAVERRAEPLARERVGTHGADGTTAVRSGPWTATGAQGGDPPGRPCCEGALAAELRLAEVDVGLGRLRAEQVRHTTKALP